MPLSADGMNDHLELRIHLTLNLDFCPYISSQFHLGCCVNSQSTDHCIAPSNLYNIGFWQESWEFYLQNVFGKQSTGHLHYGFSDHSFRHNDILIHRCIHSKGLGDRLVEKLGQRAGREFWLMRQNPSNVYHQQILQHKIYFDKLLMHFPWKICNIV